MKVKATGKHIKSSVQKVNQVVDLIRNTSAEEAVNQLTFCKRKSLSKKILLLLNSAIANSENNHGLDVDCLKVDQVLVGKSRSLKRFRVRARGRINKITKPYCNITIFLREDK